METKHTPGPWRVSEHTIIDSNDRGLAEVHIIPSRASAGAAHATALLIAAAPELFESVRLVLALHDARDASGPGGSVPGYRVHLDPMAERQLRDAIAKAEGRE